MDEKSKPADWHAHVEAYAADESEKLKRRATRRERDALGDAAQRGAPDAEILALAAEVRAAGERFEAAARDAARDAAKAPESATWPEDVEIAVARLPAMRRQVANMTDKDDGWGHDRMRTRAPAKIELAAVVLALAAARRCREDVPLVDAIEGVTTGKVSQVWERVHPEGLKVDVTYPEDDDPSHWCHYRHTWTLPSGERADSKSSLPHVKRSLLSYMSKNDS